MACETSLAEAIAAALNRLHEEHRWLIPGNGPNQFDVFGIVDLGRAADILLAGADRGAHLAEQYSALGIHFRPTGSGANGPGEADVGLTISAIKAGYPNATGTGEVDVLQIVGRNCGGGENDMNGLMVNVQNVYGSGFVSAWESQITALDPGTLAIAVGMDCQIGIINGATSDSCGYHMTATAGVIEYGYRVIQVTSNGAVTNPYNYNLDGVTFFNVDNQGKVFGRAVWHQSVLFSQLYTPFEGMTMFITDATVVPGPTTVGTVAAGGGANNALVIYRAGAWRIAA